MEIESPTARDVADAQFRLLVESVSDYAIYLLDRAGHVTSWNVGAERIKGYAASEILGRSFGLFYTPEDRAAGRPEHMLRRAEREGRAGELGWRVRKDGTRFWADVVITALREPSGALSGFAKVTRDMTAWRAAHARIQDSEALLRAFTEHSPASMFLKDAQGRYRFVNPRFLQQFGLRREEVLGRTDAELFPRAQVELQAAADALVAERGRAAIAEQRIAQFDGERIHMVVRFPVRDALGALTGVGGVGTDVTETRTHEQALQALAWQLVQAEEAERRRIATELHDKVGQALSAINIQLDIGQVQASHALIEGAMQTVEDVLADLRPPLLDEYGLGAALRSQVEDFARRTGVQATLDDRAREANRGLRRETAVGLYRIAQEALANVAQHAGAASAALTLETRDGELVLTVRDEGRGFDLAEAAGRAAGGGTGWGMTAMKERAHAAGGSLEVASTPGKGTTLTARIPL